LFLDGVLNCFHLVVWVYINIEGCGSKFDLDVNGIEVSYKCCSGNNTWGGDDCSV
jgi:hypothetical protein